jgi:hypothetical protein
VSLGVELERLLEVAGGFDTVPMLLTVDDDGRPRAASVTVSWDGVHALVSAGRRSVTNAAARPLVSLLWPAPPGERFALLVDGEVVTTEVTEPPDERGKGGGGTVVVRATSAILHVAGGHRRQRSQRRPTGG